MGASHFLGDFVSPSPPHTCGGEGRGEEDSGSRKGSFPLPIPLPAARGEGTFIQFLQETMPKTEMRTFF